MWPNSINWPPAAVDIRRPIKPLTYDCGSSKVQQKSRIESSRL